MDEDDVEVADTIGFDCRNSFIRRSKRWTPSGLPILAYASIAELNNDTRSRNLPLPLDVAVLTDAFMPPSSPSSAPSSAAGVAGFVVSSLSVTSATTFGLPAKYSSMIRSNNSSARSALYVCGSLVVIFLLLLFVDVDNGARLAQVDIAGSICFNTDNGIVPTSYFDH